MTSLGPYRTPADLQGSPLALALEALDDQTDGDPGPLAYGIRVAHLFSACDTAKIKLGVVDRRALRVLAGFGDDRLIQVIIGLIARANGGSDGL